jgi:hypothetical protein
LIRQVQEHLLDLRRVDPGVRPALGVELEAHPVLLQVLAASRITSSARRTRSVAARRSARGPGQAEHPPVMAEARCAASRIFSKARRPVVRVGVAQAELGIVEDRRQGVVQLVADPAGEDAEAADPLHSTTCRRRVSTSSGAGAGVSCGDEAIVHALHWKPRGSRPSRPAVLSYRSARPAG